MTTQEGNQFLIETKFSREMEDAKWMINDQQFPTLETALQYIQQENLRMITTSGSQDPTMTQSEITT